MIIYLRPFVFLLGKDKICLFFMIIFMGLPSLLFAQSYLSLFDPSLRGAIISPPDKVEVGRHFRVEGTVSGRYRNLWLMERIGGLHWPKEPKLVQREGRWSGEVFEGGYPPQGRFEIILVDVSDEVSKIFELWFEKGHRTGSYPGLPLGTLGNILILDKKEYRLPK
jgi:hypothetical protein